MSILTAAEDLINGQRATDYGDAKENHIRIANLWEAYTGVEFTPEDVAVMMILLKIARFMENGYHHDTVVDIAGYAGVLEKMQPTEAKMADEVKDLDEPRVWESVTDIPSGVLAITEDQLLYTKRVAGSTWVNAASNGLGNGDGWIQRAPSRGPFIEVKETA